jgi:hypothetical protein
VTLGARRVCRLALGTGLAAAFAFGRGLPLAYLVVLVSAQLLIAPVPPPKLRLAAILIVIVFVTAGWGILLGPVLIYVPVAGVLLILAGIAAASALATNPRVAIIATLIILGNTIIAVAAQNSSAAAVAILQIMVIAFVVAIIIAHVAHAVFPEDGAAVPLPAPSLAAGEAVWIGVRAALIMVLPLLLALTNPGNYLMVLMKGAQLAGQAEATDTRFVARELVVSTAYGGAAALLLWWVLGLWPSLVLLTLLFALAAFVIARPLYGVVASPHGFGHWQNVLVTMMLLIGPALTDRAGGTDITLAILQRTGIFIGLSLYAALMVQLLDGIHGHRVAA